MIRDPCNHRDRSQHQFYPQHHGKTLHQQLQRENRDRQRLQVEKNGNATKVITLAFLASLASAKALSSYINACAKSNTLGSHMARNMFAQSTCRHSTVAMKWVPKHQACSHLAFSRERLRRVLRKKAAVVIHLHTLTSADLHLHTLTSADLHLHTFTSADLHLHTFTSADLLSLFFLSLS